MGKQKFNALVIGSKRRFNATDDLKTIYTDDFIVTLIFSSCVDVLDIDFVLIDIDIIPKACVIFKWNVRTLLTKIPVLLVCSDLSQQTCQFYKSLGVMDTLEKPLTAQKLGGFVKSLNRKREQNQVTSITNFDDSLSGIEICQAITDNLIEINYKTHYLSKAFSTDSYLKKTKLVKLFKKVELFKNLSPYGMMLVLESVKKYKFDAGTVILEQGKVVDHVYIVYKGVLEILIEDEEVDQRREYDIVGEMSCLTKNRNATASVRARTDCEIWGIESRVFKKLLNYIPELRRNAFEVLSKKLSLLSLRFKEVLQHIPQGLIKIESNGIVSEEYSSKCSEYFNQTALKGKHIADILFSKETLLSKNFKKTFETIKSKPEEISELIKKLPEEITYLRDEYSPKIFKLNYQTSFSSAKNSYFIDMGVEDITTQKAYESELFAVKNILAKQELLFMIIDINTGQIIQESFSNSTLGQTHFPDWNNLGEQNIFLTILKGEDSKKKEHLNRWLLMVNDPFYQSSMGMDEISTLAPTFVFESQAGKVVELSFELDSNEKKQYDEIFCRFKFVEEKQSNETAPRLTKTLLEEVTKSEKQHKRALQETLTEMATNIENIYTLLEKKTSQKEIFTIAHSLKGLAQSFGLNTIAKQAHSVEDILKNIDISDLNDEHNIYGFLESLTASIVISKSVCFSTTQIDSGKIRNREPEIKITLSQFEDLKNKALNVLNQDTLKKLTPEENESISKLKNKILSLELTTGNNVFPRIEKILKDNYKSLNKKVRLIIMCDFKVSVKCSTDYKISSSIIQVVKNALFHGIESIYERREVGKNEMGEIFIDVNKEDDDLKISISDDGKGLNYRNILKHAVERKLIDEQQARQLIKERNFKAIYDLIFQEGLSTASKVSLLSGRGVGMGLVKSDIEKVGGKIGISSEEGKGTTVQFLIPITENSLILERGKICDTTCFD